MTDDPPAPSGRLVVDPSIILPYVLKREQHELAKVVVRHLAQMRGDAPAIFFLEVQHVLLKAERATLIEASVTEWYVERLRSLMMIHGHDLPRASVRELARRHKLGYYDATYLDLALETGQTLATRDGELRKAAVAEGVPVYPPNEKP